MRDPTKPALVAEGISRQSFMQIAFKKTRLKGAFKKASTAVLGRTLADRDFASILCADRLPLMMGSSKLDCCCSFSDKLQVLEDIADSNIQRIAGPCCEKGNLPVLHREMQPDKL